MVSVEYICDGGGISTNYFEQTMPIAVNLTQSINNTVGNKTFILAQDRGAVGLISTDDTKVEKVMLLLIGAVENTFAGTNALDRAMLPYNQWRIAPDNDTTWYYLVNGLNEDGQMLDEDWKCDVEGAGISFTMVFDVTSQVTDIDAEIGVRLEQGKAEQDSLIVTLNAFLKVLYHL